MTTINAPEITYLHRHRAIRDGDRPCEWCLRLECTRCGRVYAPCTQSPVSTESARTGRFVCEPCGGGYRER